MSQMETDVSALGRMGDVFGEVLGDVAFKPPLDVIAAEEAIVLEMVLPGVEQSDVTVERVEQMLVIHGLRRDEHGAKGRSYHHVETPRGPFCRAIPLPFALASEPQVELEQGVLRVTIAIPKLDRNGKGTNGHGTEAKYNEGDGE